MYYIELDAGDDISACGFTSNGPHNLWRMFLAPHILLFFFLSGAIWTLCSKDNKPVDTVGG